MTSAVQQLWVGYLGYGLGVGIAVACGYVPMVAVVGAWFDRRRAVALAVAVAGIGVGTLVGAPLARRADRRPTAGGRPTCCSESAARCCSSARRVRGPPAAGADRRAAAAAARGWCGPSTFRAMYAATVLASSLALFVPFVFLPRPPSRSGSTRSRAAALDRRASGSPASSAGSRSGRWPTGPGACARSGQLRHPGVQLRRSGSSRGRWPWLLAFAIVLGVGYGGWIAPAADRARRAVRRARARRPGRAGLHRGRDRRAARAAAGRRAGRRHRRLPLGDRRRRDVRARRVPRPAAAGRAHVEPTPRCSMDRSSARRERTIPAAGADQHNERAVQRQEELEAFAWPTSSPRSSGSRPTRSAGMRNKSVKSSVRTAVRKFREAAEPATPSRPPSCSAPRRRALDKAASKGVIHKNQAANRKSAMAKRLSSTLGLSPSHAAAPPALGAAPSVCVRPAGGGQRRRGRRTSAARRVPGRSPGRPRRP